MASNSWSDSATPSWRRRFLLGLFRTASVSTEVFQHYLRTLEDTRRNSRLSQRERHNTRTWDVDLNGSSGIPRTQLGQSRVTRTSSEREMLSGLSLHMGNSVRSTRREESRNSSPEFYEYGNIPPRWSHQRRDRQDSSPEDGHVWRYMRALDIGDRPRRNSSPVFYEYENISRREFGAQQDIRQEESSQSQDSSPALYENISRRGVGAQRDHWQEETSPDDDNIWQYMENHNVGHRSGPSSDSELEDLQEFTRSPDLRVSDSDFENPNLFNFLSDNSSAGTEAHNSDSEEYVDYDPDFEDPRLFRFVFNETPAPVELDSDGRQERVEENAVKKHLWPCVGCLETSPDTMFSPCSHAACCRECADRVKNQGVCPVCSAVVDHVDRIFFTQDTCVVCMDRPPETVFKPCYHAVCCGECTSTLLNGDEGIVVENKCPICKAYIEEADIFLLAYS